MLLKRILTALIGIPIIFICLYFGAFPFFVMMLLVTFFCVQEYLVLLKKYEPFTAVSLIMAVIFFIAIYFYFEVVMNNIALVALIMLFKLFALGVISGKMQNCIAKISVSFLGAFFLPLSLSYMVLIRDLPNGLYYMFFLFLTVWILDTAAYGFGKKFGKRKLAKNVSPQKTVEGAIAGIIFGIISAVALGLIFSVFAIWQSIIFGFVIAVIGQFSDLAESLIKRDADIKDSGSIIPGHGGFLDRFDSYIFAAPAFYYLLILIIPTY